MRQMHGRGIPPHVGPGAVQRGVQQQADWVDRAVAMDDAALMVDQHQLRDLDAVHGNANRVDPEAVRSHRIANRDVAQQSL